MIPAPARPVKRRPYTHLACQMCKEKHIKCDGVKPECTYCRAKRVPCVYREERNRKRDASVDGGDDTVRQLGLRVRPPLRLPLLPGPRPRPSPSNSSSIL